MSLAVQLYRNSQERNRVIKTPEFISALQCNILDPTDMLKPIIRIEYGELIDFNYIKIPAFRNRFYFVNDYRIISTGLWELFLEVDVLYTYSAAIRSLNAFIDRNEFDYNEYIVDDKKTIEQGCQVYVGEVSNDVFSETGSYIANCFAGQGGS